MSPADAPGTAAVSRRRLLAGAAGAAAVSSGGCLQRLRSRLGRRDADPVEVTVKTVPADQDARSVRVARHLTENLRAAGVDATVLPVEETELRRDVLLDHDFDVYVGSYPTPPDPDFCYPLLHSRYAGEPGWQNPFGYADLQVDDALAAQRRRPGTGRREPLATLQRLVVAGQPFSVVAFPDDVRAVHADLSESWSPFGSPSAVGLLAAGDADAPTHLRLAVTDARPTENLNPLAVAFRGRGALTGLLYDPLARWDDGGLRPWLADEWAWAAVSPPVAEVRLRPDLRWHDGTRLTARDVAFTYEFLADTSLGGADDPIPAPRFQGRASLVESVTALDDRTARVRFVESDPGVARRAFTVPVLPRHVWRDRSDRDVVPGVSLPDGLPRALTLPNLPPVGSGPLRFESASRGDQLVLSRNDDHLLHRESNDLPYRVPFERVTFSVLPSDDAAVAVAAAGEVDAVASPLDPATADAVERAGPLDLVVAGSRSFFHVGFNVRRAPLSNPRFRRTVARLLDREHLVDEAFDGYARAAWNPLADTRWEASVDGSWLSFLGTGGDVDEGAARAAFQEAGFRYDDADRLVYG